MSDGPKLLVDPPTGGDERTGESPFRVPARPHTPIPKPEPERPPLDDLSTPPAPEPRRSPWWRVLGVAAAVLGLCELVLYFRSSEHAYALSWSGIVATSPSEILLGLFLAITGGPGRHRIGYRRTLTGLAVIGFVIGGGLFFTPS